MHYHPDLVAIDTTNNNMVVYRGSANGLSTAPTAFRTGWIPTFVPVGIVDYNHTGQLGVITIERDNNLLWFYPGDLTGGITAARVQIGAGWTSAYLPVGHGDVTGDGHADVVSCRTDINSVQVSPGDGTGGSGSPSQLVNGCANNTFFGVTDYTGDGRPDLIARDDTTGNIVVAAGNGADGWLNNSTSTIAINW